MVMGWRKGGEVTAFGVCILYTSRHFIIHKKKWKNMTNGRSIVMFENNSEMRNFLKICIFYRFNKYIKISLFAFARYTV